MQLEADDPCIVRYIVRSPFFPELWLRPMERIPVLPDRKKLRDVHGAHGWEGGSTSHDVVQATHGFHRYLVSLQTAAMASYDIMYPKFPTKSSSHINKEYHTMAE